jgi:hypothetical protein
MARMASPLSGMATSDHSCSGDAPLGFGSTVTIFHPVVMDLRLTSSLVPLIRQPTRDDQISLPQLASRGEWLAMIGPLVATSLKPRCNKDRNPPGGALLVFRVRRIRRDGKLPEPRPVSLALDQAHPHRSHHGLITEAHPGARASLRNNDVSILAASSAGLRAVPFSRHAILKAVIAMARS